MRGAGLEPCATFRKKATEESTMCHVTTGKSRAIPRTGLCLEF